MSVGVHDEEFFGSFSTALLDGADKYNLGAGDADFVFKDGFDDVVRDAMGQGAGMFDGIIAVAESEGANAVGDVEKSAFGGDAVFAIDGKASLEHEMASKSLPFGVIDGVFFVGFQVALVGVFDPGLVFGALEIAEHFEVFVDDVAEKVALDFGDGSICFE